MKLRKLVALGMVGIMTLGLVACGGKDDADGGKTDGGNTPTEKVDVSLRMWGAEEDQEMLQGMIDSFKEQYKDKANITIELGVESEASAKDTILTDVETAADVYAFASDQINDLVKAGALLELDSNVDAALKNYAGKGVDDIKKANASGSVDAASIDGKMYAFPMSADNGYFLLYDSSVLSADDVKSWDAMLAAADKAGKKVGMVMNSGWYNASFFYGAGFTTGLNADGTTAIDWAGKADFTGVEVVQAMLGITSNPAFLAINDGETGAAFSSGNYCAIISGTWDVGAAATDETEASGATGAWGENFKATKLPTYTCAGKQVQQGSVAGFKLVGVNPYSKNAGWAALLAEWITNEQNQTIRFEKRAIGPSNVKAASSDAVKSNIGIAALSEQSAYGVVQTVGGKFWDPTATFGKNIAEGTVKADDTAGIQKLLDDMTTGVTAAVE